LQAVTPGIGDGGLFIGLLDLIIGFILLIHPIITEDILPYIVGFILMFKSIDYIAESLQISALKIRGWGWIFIAGIITLFFSFMIVFYPLFGIFNIKLPLTQGELEEIVVLPSSYKGVYK